MCVAVRCGRQQGFNCQWQLAGWARWIERRAVAWHLQCAVTCMAALVLLAAGADAFPASVCHRAHFDLLPPPLQTPAVATSFLSFRAPPAMSSAMTTAPAMRRSCRSRPPAHPHTAMARSRSTTQALPSGISPQERLRLAAPSSHSARRVLTTTMRGSCGRSVGCNCFPTAPVSTR